MNKFNAFLGVMFGGACVALLTYTAHDMLSHKAPEVDFVNQKFDTFDEVQSYVLDKSCDQNISYVLDRNNGDFYSIHVDDCNQSGTNIRDMFVLNTSDSSAFKRVMVDANHPIYAAMKKAADKMAVEEYPPKSDFIVANYDHYNKMPEAINAHKGDLLIAYKEVMSGLSCSISGIDVDTSTVDASQNGSSQTVNYYKGHCDIHSTPVKKVTINGFPVAKVI